MGCVFYNDKSAVQKIFPSEKTVMAYNELIKNFDRIREYMREFYIYGFRSRGEYDMKSARSYDDERRRIESWLKDYTGFRHTGEGKNVFISIDSRENVHNPLFSVWKARSFTDGDITLHFIIFDILSSPEIKLSSSEITEITDRDYLSQFEKHRVFDESTIRKKLKKYTDMGLIQTEKQGKNVLYSRTEDMENITTDAMDFFSETVPCGVAGSFILDRENDHRSVFLFKHHYISHVLDSEIHLELFKAIHRKYSVVITKFSHGSGADIEAVPLKLFISARTGRQYLLAYNISERKILPFRTDFIKKIRPLAYCENFDELRDKLAKHQENMWGVNTGYRSRELCHVEFTVYFGPDEEHIPKRLEREKRCGRVELTDENHCRFTADVYDVSEMIPWIRTYICRITDLSFSDKDAERRFLDDLEHMYRLYDAEEVRENDIQ